MIAVIADDFTGAAEIGGIALRHNLNVEICLDKDFNYDNNNDLLIIVSDSRSMTESDAVIENEIISDKLSDIKYDFVYKKIDSVFRGFVYQELIKHMSVFDKNRSILIAGNPGLQRIIKNGKYYINNISLSETCFSKDPEFPVKSSVVRELLNYNGNYSVYSDINPYDIIPENGIIVGNVVNNSDLESWTDHLDDNTFPAGAAGFFNAILKCKDFSKFNKVIKSIENDELESADDSSILFVAGSYYEKNKSFYSKIKDSGFLIIDMPLDLYLGKDIENNFLLWKKNVLDALFKNKKTAIVVSHRISDVYLKEKIKYIRDLTATLVSTVINDYPMDELYIEGGSTASAIFKKLGITRLYPIYEFEMGVIKIKCDEYKNMNIITKPGSYIWPDTIFNEKYKLK